MTKDELLDLYNKVYKVVWDETTWSNHYTYTITDPEISANGLTFEVITHNDQYEEDEWAEWTEYWSIDNDGSIWVGNDKYKDFEDFRYNW